MYVPKRFEAPSLEAVENFIRDHGFATLISQDAGQIVATHIPLIINEKSDGTKVLSGHISRANNQKNSLASGEELMAIFMEHHTYISSSWYDHINVPTWNYISVHVYGTSRCLSDEELYQSLDQLVNKYETGDEASFNIKKMPQEMLNREMKAIIGFEIEVTRVEAAYKLSQNRDAENMKRIIEQLEKRGDEFSLKIAQEMRQLR